jgi:ligand-binding sensor domain-containing protein
LYALKKGSTTPLMISHTQAEIKAKDSLNVKVLHTDDHDTLWVGTVEGLFSMSLSQARRFVLTTRSPPETKLHIKHRNIWQLANFKKGLFYVATDKGLFSYQTKSNVLQQILLPTDSREFIVSDVLRNLVVDNRNNLWLGSENDGAIYWSPKMTLFNNVYNTRGGEGGEREREGEGGRGEKVLSHNNIWSIHQQDENSLWVGTRNDLNLFNFSDGSTQSFLMSDDTKTQYSSSSINNIEAGKDNQLWLNTADGVLRFSAKAGKSYPLKANSLKDDTILKSDILDIFITPKEELLLVSDLGFFSYSPDTGIVDKLEQLSATINSRDTVRFIKGVRPNTTLISVYGQLWEMNDSDTQVSLIHATPLQQLKSKIYPSDVLVDANNIMWITYSGFGLVGIDAVTYEKKFFIINKTFYQIILFSICNKIQKAIFD